MKISNRGILLWCAYALFIASAVSLNWHDRILSFDGPLWGVKLVIWSVLFTFLGYSIYCSTREDLLQSIWKIIELHWGRQIGLDLYIGAMLALFIIFLNEGAFIAVLWLVPILLFVNLAILLYFAIHFDSIVMRFLG